MKKQILIAALLNILIFNNAFANYYIENNNNEQHFYRISPKETLADEKTDYTSRHYYEKTKKKMIRPYVGVELSNSQTSFASSGDNYLNKSNLRGTNLAASGVLGIRVFDYLGVEGFYQRSSNEKKKKEGSYGDDGKYVNSGAKMFDAYGADLVGYIPITRDMEILAALGFGQYNFETSFTTSYYVPASAETPSSSTRQTKDFDAIGTRFGLGMQYVIEDTVAIRGMVRYIKLNKKDYIKDLTEVSLGMYYLF